MFNKLCLVVFAIERHLCISYIDPRCVYPLIACWLIPLLKNPGVRPIGVCESLRRIIGKAILQVVGQDIQSAVGSAQLCASQRSGCETVIFTLRQIFDGDAEDMLLVNVRNAFNSFNWQVMLHNVSVLCPSFALCVINYY